MLAFVAEIALKKETERKKQRNEYRTKGKKKFQIIPTLLRRSREVRFVSYFTVVVFLAIEPGMVKCQCTTYTQRTGLTNDGRFFPSSYREMPILTNRSNFPPRPTNFFSSKNRSTPLREADYFKTSRVDRRSRSKELAVGTFRFKLSRGRNYEY